MQGATRYRWRARSVVLGLLLYSAAVVVGAIVIHARALGVTAGIHLLRVTALSIFGLCMITERGSWVLWKRIAFVPGAWLIYAYVCVPVAFVPLAIFAPTYPGVVTESVVLVASLPLVVWAMRHSRLFVVEHSVEPGRQQIASDDRVVVE